MSCHVAIDMSAADGPLTVQFLDEDSTEAPSDFTAHAELLATIGLQRGAPQDPAHDTVPFAEISLPDGISATLNGCWPVDRDLLGDLIGAGLVTVVRDGMAAEQHLLDAAADTDPH